ALYGAGTFNLAALAQFTNFEQVDVTNTTGNQLSLILNDAPDLAVNWTSNGFGGVLTLGNGARSVVANNLNGVAITFGSGPTTFAAESIGYSTLNLGSGTSSLTVGYSYGSTYNFSDGDTTITLRPGENDTLNLGSGSSTIYLNGSYWDYAFINLNSGQAEIHALGGRAIVNVTSASYWKAGDILDGQSSQVSSISISAPGTFSAGTVQLIGSWGFNLSAATTLSISSADLSHISHISGPGAATTADAALDLTHMFVGANLQSTNAAGTVFTVADLSSAQHILGG
ncbi:hypothetical protein, partial [Sphingobium tyrosinilyticum]